MKLYPWIGLAAAVAVLGACDRPQKGAAASSPVPVASVAKAPLNERAGPVRWSAGSGAFQLNGKALKAAKLWTFDGSTEGFSGVSSKLEPAVGQGLLVHLADPTLRSPKGLNVVGGQFPLVLVRLTRNAAGEAWDGALYYSTASHPEAIGFLGKPLSGANPAVGETTTLIYDMSRQTTGAPDWTHSTIDQIRFDIEDKPGGIFTILEIAITENPMPGGIVPTPAATTIPTAPPKP